MIRRGIEARKLFGSTELLGIVSADATPEPLRSRTLSLLHFGNTVLGADQVSLARLTAMHSAVLNRINRLDMLWSATRLNMAAVMDMISRRPMQGLINKPMNFLQLVINSHMAVPVSVCGTRPYPTFATNHQTVIKASQLLMREHVRSIQNAGFNARGLPRSRSDESLSRKGAQVFVLLRQSLGMGAGA